MTYPNLWNVANGLTRGKFTVSNAYIQKEEIELRENPYQEI